MRLHTKQIVIIHLQVQRVFDNIFQTLRFIQTQYDKHLLFRKADMCSCFCPVVNFQKHAHLDVRKLRQVHIHVLQRFVRDALVVIQPHCVCILKHITQLHKHLPFFFFLLTLTSSTALILLFFLTF